MKVPFIYSVPLAMLFLLGCVKKNAQKKQVVVINKMNFDRSQETVSLDIKSLSLEKHEGTISILDAASKEMIVSQVIDSNGDGSMDAILFQPEISANSKRVFEIALSKKKVVGNDVPSCYSRLVPERTDDYAWENNKVAFRTFGPAAQKLYEDGISGGTLSSGIDAWLKRVEYPIIEKWYKKELETDESYHQDTGEGLDNFHVGASRGIGGLAKKKDSVYYVSKNFISSKTFNIGSVRTSFELTYEDWKADGNSISEAKHISLDHGSNLSKFEVSIEGVDKIAAGLTLHEKDGTIEINKEEGWISYWETHEDSQLGTGIIVPNNKMVGVDHYDTEKKDESNLYANIELNKDGKVIYYAGFGWKKSGQFHTKSEWNKYLSDFAKRLKNPLIVEIK